MEDLKDLFDDQVKQGHKVSRVAYKPDVSNYAEFQTDDDATGDFNLKKEDKGFSVSPSLLEKKKALQMKRNIEEMIDHGYEELDTVARIKVFKQILKEMGAPF